MEYIPHGPVYRSDSDSEQVLYRQNTEQAYTRQLSAWLESTMEEAVNAQKLNEEQKMVAKYAQALVGNMWDPRRPRYRSKFVDNRLMNARQSDLAVLTDTKPTISVESAVDAYKDQAKICSMAIQNEWLNNNMDLDLIYAADIARLNGTSFWKVGAAAPGRMSLVSCGPESVIPIQPEQLGLQTSSAVLYQTFKGIAYFRNKFPWRSAGIEKEADTTSRGQNSGEQYHRPAQISDFVWNGLTPAMKRALGAQSPAPAHDVTGYAGLYTNIQLREIYVEDPSVNESQYNVLLRHPNLPLDRHNFHYWVRPGERLYPRKRMLVFAGRRCVYDGPSPYWHGLYPFACMRLNPVSWSFYGISKYRTLLPLTEALNEIGAGCMDMVKRYLNPTLISKTGAVAPAAWKEFFPDAPGGKLLVNANSEPASAVRYIDPPQLPAAVFTFHQYLAGEFDRLAGTNDISALGKKKQVPGGDTIEAMRDMMNSVTRLESRFIETFLEDAGKLAVSNFFQFYTMEHRLKTLGAAGITDADFDSKRGSIIPDHLPEEDFWRMFSMRVGQGSLLNNQKDREKQMAVAMAQKGLYPVLALYKLLELPDPEELYKELVKQMNDGIGGQSASHSGGGRMTRGQRNGQPV
jgi:hypothetical protein